MNVFWGADSGVGINLTFVLLHCMACTYSSEPIVQHSGGKLK